MLGKTIIALKGETGIGTGSGPHPEILTKSSRAALSALVLALGLGLAAPSAVAQDIQPPADPAARAAFDVLTKHCSRCHQDGRLVDRAKPAKNFGFILDLDRLAKEPRYINPGSPENSLIFSQIIKQQMPYDLYNDGKPVPEPTREELGVLAAWISGLGQQQASICETQKFITNSDVIASIAGDLNKTPQGRLKGQRYLTLTHLYNACVEPAAMEAYRQGAVKLLNSLSRSSDVVRLEAVDPQKTILRFNLIDLGWEDADWNDVIAVYPYKVKPEDKLFGFLTQATDNQLPFVRADWFGFTASQPDLYNKLLKLPADFKALQQQQGLDVDANIQKSVAQRAGAAKSGISQNNRVIERHPIRTGFFWTTYDFAGTRANQNIFSFPIGPAADGFKHDGQATMFSLPNGFLGYFLTNAAGASINKSPTNILRDPSRSDLTVTNGISCMACHDQGIKPWRDEIRQTVLADRTSFPRAVRDAVESLYPPVERMDSLLADDARRFRGAMERAGLNPNLKWNGVEVIGSLSNRYEAPVELALLAAEFGMKPDELQRASQGSARANQLMRRLAQGPVPRDQFEEEFARLVPEVTPDEVLELQQAAAQQGGAGAQQGAAQQGQAQQGAAQQGQAQQGAAQQGQAQQGAAQQGQAQQGAAQQGQAQQGAAQQGAGKAAGNGKKK
jgi:hypothetical protein